MDNKQIILGVVGQIGSGKDTVTAYIVKNYDAGYYRDSKTLRQILDLLHLEYNRKNLSALANTLRSAFGEDVLARATHKQLLALNKPILIADGTRRVGELDYMRSIDNYTLVYVDVDIKKRYERIKERGQKADDINKTFEEFLQDHKNGADSQVASMKERADHVIDNSGSLEDLYRNIDKLMHQLGYNKILITD